MSPVFSASDHAHMARALQRAGRGLATTMPNPRVGCVIARGDEVLGEGWHQRAGGPHAEADALAAAGAGARGATAYVTLEPCAHHGRTPPCADALIEAGVARVVIASADSSQQSAGIDRLRAAGIQVETGLMQAQARELNRGFFSRIERGRPWLRVKLAMSLDGRTALASGESKWITSPGARADVQRWRARSSALLTGIGTVLADDPALTVRPQEAGEAADMPFVPPLRVVLDRRLRTPAGVRLLDGSAPTLLLHGAGTPVPAHLAAVECQALAETPHGLDLAAVLAELGARGMNEVQVEAGPILSGALLAAGLVDEVLLYIAPVLLGDAARPLFSLPPLSDMAARWQLETIEQCQVGPDLRWLLRPA